ncbi:Metallo-hydrolase/oxidoreductase [Mucidula mucida]|nr:Metallo-hydrolase/oxidoreductase [Mucidula mucida]
MRKAPAPPHNIVPVRKPTWGWDVEEKAAEKQMKATWLGHACFLLELSSGVRILFDPVFSDRCSPSQLMGPKRFTDAPCTIEEIPPVDAIVISHNHYDHLDTHTITTLFKTSKRMPHIFAPLGNEHYFSSLGILKTHFHTLDWWQKAELTVPSAKDSSITDTLTLTCTPAQHRTGRGILDQLKTLWSSWVVTTSASKNIFFAGDTGYRYVPDGADENEMPYCPAFEEIGERFGEMEMAMIPIGAYEPRWFMSPMHCAPQDSVRVFRDVRAKRAVAMHWGAWVLTTEDVLEPPRKLKEECKKLGIEDGVFTVCDIGETTFF